MSSEVIGGYNRLSQEVMPRTEETYTRLIDLYSSEQQGNRIGDLDLERTDQKIEGVLLSLSEKITEASNNINELTKKT